MGLEWRIRYQFTPEMVAGITGKHPIYKAPPPVVVPYNWTGFYVGAYGGITYGNRTGYVSCSAPPSPDVRFDGAIAGGQIGYNYQFADGWVAGVEFDGGWSNAIGLRMPKRVLFCV